MDDFSFLKNIPQLTTQQTCVAIVGMVCIAAVAIYWIKSVFK